MSGRSVVVAAICTLTGCGDDRRVVSTGVTAETVSVLPTGFALEELSIATADGDRRTINVWVADSTDERQRGLMEVTELGEGAGMLFVFHDEAIHRFYMWQTPLPLDIAFLDADGTVVDSASMEPCLEPPVASCARYAPDEPYTMALEVPAGALDELGIAPGARLDRS